MSHRYCTHKARRKVIIDGSTINECKPQIGFTTCNPTRRRRQSTRPTRARPTWELSCRPISQSTNYLISQTKRRPTTTQLTPTSSDRHTEADIGLDHYHSNKLFSCSPYTMRRVRGLRFIRLMRVAEEDNRALAFRELTGEGGSVVDHLNYLTVRRAGSLDGWVRVGTGGR